MRYAILVVVSAVLFVTAAYTQTRGAAAGVKASTRTPWGDPDLQGVWNFAAGTPLERPAALARKEFLTDEELAQAERQARARSSMDRRDGAGTDADVNRDANDRPVNCIVFSPDGRTLASACDDETVQLWAVE